VAIFVHFDILLGFLDSVGLLNIRGLLLIINIVLLSYLFWNTPLLENALPIFINFFGNCWCIFNALPLGIRLFIFIRLYLIIYNLDIEFFVLKASSRPWDFSSILNSESSNSGNGSQPPTPGGDKLLPTGDISQASGLDATINGIIEKIKLQFKEGTDKSIYSDKWDNSAVLNDGEKKLLLTKINALNKDDIKPYALYERDIYRGRSSFKEWRVVQITKSFPTLTNHSPEVRPTLKFVDLLMKVNKT
jgi:hypothetical protein